MAQSPEYPDLKFVPPKAYGKGRDGKAVRYIVIHYTAGSERATSAEDGAAYDARRTDGTSTHYFVDSNSVVQCVKTTDRANTARSKGNRLGIQYELCGTVQTRAQWLDAASLPMLRNAAKQAARDCKRYGIPVRRLSVTETRRAWTEFPDGPRGFVGHVDCTFAYPEDGGDHTDPGKEFPWDAFLEMVREELQPKTQEVSEMTKDEWVKLQAMLKETATDTAREVWAAEFDIDFDPKRVYKGSAGSILAHAPEENGKAEIAVREIKEELAATRAELAEIKAMVSALAGEGPA